MNKGPYSQSYSFSRSHIWMWELDQKEGWRPKDWCFWAVVLDKTLENPLDCKEIQPLHPKGTQPSIFTGRTDTEAEVQYFGHLMWRTDSLEKIMMLGKFDARRRKGRQRMRWLDGITGYGFERTLRDSEGHGSLMCCSPWGCKLSDTTEWLNNNNISSPGLSHH